MQHKDRVKLVDLGVYHAVAEQGLVIGSTGTVNLDAVGNHYFLPDNGKVELFGSRADQQAALGWPVEPEWLEALQ